MKQAFGSKRRMVIEVHWKNDVRVWEQCLIGIPRQGERLTWTCYTDDGEETIEAKVNHLLWRVDGPDSEDLMPTVVCKAVRIRFCDKTEMDYEDFDLPDDCDWDDDWHGEDDWDDDDDYEDDDEDDEDE